MGLFGKSDKEKYEEYMDKGDTLYAKENYQDAWDYYAEAMKLGDNGGACVKSAGCALGLGDKDSAVELLRIAVTYWKNQDAQNLVVCYPKGGWCQYGIKPREGCEWCPRLRSYWQSMADDCY